jgi:signal peptidase complex subunit 2
VLGLLTCATALVAQFYPTPFPENYPLLVGCVVTYFLLNTLLQAFVLFYEGDTILSLSARSRESPATYSVSSSLPRYSEIYTLTLRSAGGAQLAQLSKSVSAWLYDDGDVDIEVFKRDVTSLLGGTGLVQG